MKNSNALRAAVCTGALTAALISICAASYAQTTIISPTVNDGSFETPVTSGVASLAGTPWSTTGSAGVSVNSSDNSTYGVVGGPADGNQYAFLQVGSTLLSSTISQSFTLSSLSNLAISFDIAGRSGGAFGGATTLSAALDGTTFSSATTSDNEPFTLSSFNLTNIVAGAHTLTFTATQIGGSTADNTGLLDNVNLSATAATGAPEPASLALALSVGGFPLAGLWVRRRRAR